MRKIPNVIILIFFSILLIACSQIDSNEEVVSPIIFTGEIVKLEDGRFLVESFSNDNYNVQFSSVWVSNYNMESLEVGQIITVWTDFIDTSEPAQASAIKIEIKE